jgi:membrane protease YdiL (CAAX protease family)
MSAMTSQPWFLVLLTGVSACVAALWAADYRAARAGRPKDNALPGATPASPAAMVVALLGALAILAAEAVGEQVLGLGAEQSTMTALFALYSVAGAPVIEEIVFRGYLVIERRGRAALWGGVVGVSLLFALLHPFLWDASGGAKGWFTTTVIFTASLWLYTVRVFGLNTRRSLLPCFVAHAGKNLGVVAIKYAQGFVGGWW